MNTPILDALKNRPRRTRFHMPGHKGRLHLFNDEFRYDVTELDGLDNLLEPQGAIAASQALYATEVGAKAAFYSVNGSSAGIIAAVLSCVNPGEKIIVARDVHLSVINALRLSGARPVYVSCACTAGALQQPVNARDVIHAIGEHPDAKAVILTYVNYYGMCADLGAVCSAARPQGMIVIADAAHGAHFPYSDKLPLDAGKAGADIWIVSLHKTLPALNPSAAVCVGERADERRVKDCLNTVQTTSPSYLALASIDYARDYMNREGEKALSELIQRIEIFKERVKDSGIAVCKTDDPTRLVLNMRGYGISGFRAEELLLSCGVEAECADENNLLLITTVFDTDEDFEKLADALREIPHGQEEGEVTSYVLPPEYELTPAETMRAPRKVWPLRESLGCCAAKNILAYPPGVPILIEGQRITQGDISLIETLAKKGYNLIGYDSGNINITSRGI